MSDDPCAELKREMVDAAIEAEAAHSAKARWAVPQQIDRIEDIVVQETGGLEEVIAVFRNAHETEAKSRAALTVWIECLNNNR